MQTRQNFIAQRIDGAIVAGMALIALLTIAATAGGQERLPVPIPNASGEQVSATPVSELRLEDLEALALRHNPTLAQAGAAIDQQRGVLRQVGLYPNPQLGYLRSDPSNGNGTRSDGVFISQEIVTRGKLGLSRAVEAQEVRRLETEFNAQQMRVLVDLRIRYYEALGAQQAIAISQELHHLASEGLRLAEQLHQAQGATRADVLQARIQEQGAGATLDDAHARFDSAWRQMTAMVGLPQMAPVALVGRVDDEIPQLNFEGCFANLVAASPQLQAAQIRISHAQQELRRERAAVVPNVTVQTVTEFDHTSNVTNVSTLLAAPIPLFNRNQGNISHAYADIREASAEVQRVRLVLHDQLAETFRRYETARQRVERLQKRILPDSAENLRLVSEGQRQGEFNLFQVLTARQLYSQSQLAYVESAIEMRKVVTEIDGLLLTGGLNPATLGAAIQSQGGVRSQGLLNQLQESSSQQLLPGAIQAIGP